MVPVKNNNFSVGLYTDAFYFLTASVQTCPLKDQKKQEKKMEAYECEYCKYCVFYIKIPMSGI